MKVTLGRGGGMTKTRIAAAWTARLCSEAGGIEWFGDIAVPTIAAS